MDVLTGRPAVAGHMTESPAPLLPPEAPLAMPVQDLGRWTRPAHQPSTRPAGLWLRRLFVMGGAAGMTMIAAWQMYLVLSVGGLTMLEAVVLALFVVLFAWISFSCTSAIGGALAMIGGGRPLGIDPAAPLPAVTHRVALLMPTYNEAPERVLAGLQATYESLQETGAGAWFDVFILSDTTDPDAWVAEEAGVLALRARLRAEHPGAERIFYRRRPKNIDRKAGNIGEWVTHFGGTYESMIVLDADSVMTGDAIVRLAGAMEAHPDVGLIQTLPIIVGGRTLFARAQQFAGRLYGPLLAQGLAWWHGADSNYWGHNAIIRVAAFAGEAGLPHLKGRTPFGGHILSHDFIEAALIRRGGWGVHMVPGLEGSYEEGPPSLTDLAIRDRRWCQGNLQHAAVLPARGLAFASRVHLLTGIGSYITSPLWLVLLLVGLAISVQARFIPPDYFPSGASLFPNWPAQDPVRAAWVFGGTMAVLLLPKFIAYGLLLFSARRRSFGGGVAAFAGLIVETLISGLAAPILMVVQSGGVAGILLGRDAGWQPQRRDDGSVPFRDTLRRYAPETILGLVLAATAWLIAVELFYWMLPVILGLVLAVPIAAGTARRGWGGAFARLGLLRTPEETAPPAVLQRARALSAQLAATGPMPDAVGRLAADPALLAAHRAMLPSGGRRPKGDVSVERLVGLAKAEDAETLAEALARLTAREKAAVLGDATGLDRLLDLARRA